MIRIPTAYSRYLHPFVRLATCTALLSLTHSVHADGFHYQIQAATQFVANPAGELTALKMAWTYDPELAAILLEDEDLSEANKAATLKQRASDILADLAKLGYFTQLAVDGQAVATAPVQDYQMSLTNDQSLLLSFQLPLKTAIPVVGKKLSLRLADPDGVGALSYKDPQQVSLDEALSKRCTSPRLSQETLDLPNDHKLSVPIVQLECQ